METMNPEWITKARQALETGQPRLAELYMRRGLCECADSRQRLASYDIRKALSRLAGDLELIIRTTRAELFPAPPKPAFIFDWPEPTLDYNRLRIEETVRAAVRTRHQILINEFGGVA